MLLCSAGASAVFVLGQVHNLRDALSQNSALNLPSGTLAPTGWGQPETLLLVGDDQRALTQYYHNAVLPHSNEMLLVRIDPSKPYISMMSIPRELEATIYPPGQAAITTRFNYAYTAGGIPLLVSTIKRVIGLSVNHVMVITFARFKRAVDRLGCVYSTVDRRYFHVNVPGGEQYQEINLQAGYQNVCGTQALEFVSYRHDDTSLVRDARDQSFLLDVKKQYGGSLVDNIGKFERIFGAAVQTDPGLHSTTGILNLIGTLISSAGRRVRQVQFHVNLVPISATPCACVTASSQQIAASVHSFLHGGSPLPTQSTAAVARAVHSAKGVAHLPLTTAGPTELASARAAAAKMPFPYEYPRVQDAGGVGQPIGMREYLIHAPGGNGYPIYVQAFPTGQLGQYYDVQGTTWTNPPLLNGSEQTVRVGRRNYSLYYSGQALNVIAWHEHGALYWVRNTLNNVVSNGELLAIAEQTEPVVAAGAASGTGRRSRAKLKAARVPRVISVAQPTDLAQTLGGLAALLTLVAVLVLAVLVLRRRSALRDLRGELALAMVSQDRLVRAMPAAAAAAAAPAAQAPTSTATGKRRVKPKAPVLSVIVALAAGGALAGFLASGGGSPAAHARSAQVLKVPSVPVAVLNATPQTGAAARLAQQLRSAGVRVATVGNVVEPRARGLLILYGRNDRPQALSLARLLRASSPQLAPFGGKPPVTRSPVAVVIA